MERELNGSLSFFYSLFPYSTMLRSETTLSVRYYETDAMGIVHHSNYLRYFECGRHQCLVDLGLPIEKIENKYGIMMPVVSTLCNYKIPAHMGDTLRIVSHIDHMPMAKLEVLTEIYNQHEQLVCEGKVMLGFIHATNRRPTRIPAPLAAIFTPFFTSTDVPPSAPENK